MLVCDEDVAERLERDAGKRQLPTPSPQSMTYAAPLLTTTCAEPELAFPGRSRRLCRGE
jgi:hypothetical protein